MLEVEAFDNAAVFEPVPKPAARTGLRPERALAQVRFGGIRYAP
jgi:hypothetical protein